MPTIPEVAYAALLYRDGEIPGNPPSARFVQGAAAAGGENLVFSFQKPDDTSGTFTLELFAFGADTDAADFSRGRALLSGSKAGCTIEDNEIKVNETIALLANTASEANGTVSLKIKLPDACTLEIDDARFAVTGDSSEFTLTQAGDGISAGAYPLTFTVKKGGEIVSLFSEYINVFSGMCTDTWSDAGADGAKVIAQGMISSSLYVRGAGGWYAGSDYDETAPADDDNTGIFLSPLATIQKAVEKIIAINDGESAHTIYVDGTFTATSSAALADFSSLSQPLNIKIAGLSASNKAVLDGKNSARGIVVGASGAQKDVNLTLENLVIQNTQNSGRGGGITLYCTAGNSHMIKNCEITNNNAAYGSAIYNEYGSLDLQDCVITGNTTETSGTVYNGQASAILTMSDVRIENNSAGNGGGIFLGNNATVKISDASVVIKNNSASGNSRGPGISLWNGYLELSGSAKIDDIVGLYGGDIHEIVISGELTAESPVATITPSACTAGTQVLSGAAATLAANCGKFEVSEAGWKIDEEGKLAVAPDIYVSEGGDDTNGKGSQAKPFATLQKAFDLIKTLNLSTVSYTVHISGAVKGKSELSADVSAQKISITGTTGAKLDGNDAIASALLTISCSAPVEITNVMLTNIRASAIYVKSGANVTLGKGAAVFNNNFTVGGVDIASGGTFTMKSGATISENKNRTSGGGGGGGVRNKGTFIMEGGTISGNYVSLDKEHGGGVYSSGTFIMKGGEISGNYTSTSYSTGCGGGVYIAGGTFEMTGGTISGNRASSAGKGGGVYVSSGTFTMGGSASIPAGDDGKNDVYLASGKKITIAGALSKTEVATITLPDSAYAAGTQVLSVDGVSLYESTCDKFAVTPDSDGVEWKIAPGEGNTAGVLFRSAFYVRGSGAGWYAENPAFTASAGSDTTGNGTKTKPFATIQKAVDTVLAQNDGSSKYTIYVDGTLTLNNTPTNGMADFSALTKNLTLTITALSGTTKATLDANKKSRVIYSPSTRSLSLKNLNVMNGYAGTGSGGGIYCDTGSDLYVTNCTIGGCEAGNKGGGVYKSSVNIVITDCTISGNKADYGGGMYIGSGLLNRCNGTTTISGNSAKEGGGLYLNGSGAFGFTMNAGTISGNTATEHGGGIYKDRLVGDRFTQNGGTVSGNSPDDVYTP